MRRWPPRKIQLFLCSTSRKTNWLRFSLANTFRRLRIPNIHHSTRKTRVSSFQPFLAQSKSWAWIFAWTDRPCFAMLEILFSSRKRMSLKLQSKAHVLNKSVFQFWPVGLQEIKLRFFGSHLTFIVNATIFAFPWFDTTCRTVPLEAGSWIIGRPQSSNGFAHVERPLLLPSVLLIWW